MWKLVEAFEELRDESKSHGSWLESTPFKMWNVYAVIHNLGESARELLTFYSQSWLPVEFLLKKKEYMERLLVITRSAFIFTLSVIEYAMKDYIKHTTSGPLLDWFNKSVESGGKVYLSGIIRKSRELNMVDEVQCGSWIGMNVLRNAMMHNNAIAEENAVLKVGTMRIRMAEGEVVRMPLLAYPRLIRVLLSLSRNWLERYSELHTM